MQITETLNDSLKREFRIVLPVVDAKRRTDERLEALKSQVRLPGFRPGKVPASLLRKRYGQSVLAEVADGLIKDAMHELTDHRGLRPAAQPRLDVDGTLEEGKDIALTLKLEILPEIPEMDFSALTLEREVIGVEESAIDDALEEMRKYVESHESIPENAAAEMDHTVVIDFVGRLNGEAFDGGSAKGHSLKLGSGQFIPGFEEQLVGVKAGESRDVTVTFPDDYGSADLAGKEAVFEVTVHDVQKAVLPDIDEEFAKKFGADSVDDLRTKLRTRLESDYEGVSFSRLKPRLLDALAPLCDFPVPEVMLDAEFEAIWREVDAARTSGQLDEEDQDKSEEQLKADYRDIALRRVRLGLLLAETGRRDNITITQDEMRQLLMQEMQRYPGQEKMVMDFYRQNQEALERLRAPLFEDKTCKAILEKINVTDKNVSLKDLQDETGAESAPAKKKAAAQGASKAKKDAATQEDDEKAAPKKAPAKKKKDASEA